MPDKMLIDASHKEETRVVVIRGNRIEEFDFESQHKKQLRGNIYLAKVTRVEPSLQAAFVDYGGNRHGFLAFSEIHPDYYQIPLADRQALIQAEAESASADADMDLVESAQEPPASPSKTKTRTRKTRAAKDDTAKADDEAADSAAEKPKPKARRSRSRKKADTAQTAPDTAPETTPETATAPAISDDADASNAQLPSPARDLENSDPQNTDLQTSDASPADTRPGAEDTSKTDAQQVDGEDDNGDNPEGTGKGSGGRSMAAIIDADVISEDARQNRDQNGDADRDDDGEDDDNDGNGDADDEDNGSRVDLVGAEDALEELPERADKRPRKQYRIQEVIKRRQILLVQVVKEERGNKGAALTTYLSLAGRYSVLMPNTARGGGISRKITNLQDRKRLKEIARELDVPQGMGVILRTAGANRTKAEIKRDFEYLMRLWENVRTLTLNSIAPTLVYEEGSLIKRSIRDLYNKDVSQIVVAGEDGYREAKDFMKMLMPSHAKVVQPYREIHPIFARAGIEAQLDKMLQPQVTLKSGGYIIINQTEALVAIDVNSGRSTREHSIEDTALQTNLEAAEEVARQLRLRDLAGLIVVDFIDMEEKRNNRAVEKRMKDCLKNDRARIQVGRISHFGLLEMSRQRIRASVLESTMQVCEACGGTGHVRSMSSVALHVLRGIEDHLLKNTTHNITVRTDPETALYILNQKRDSIVDMGSRFGVRVLLEADRNLGGVHFAIDRGTPVESPVTIEAPADGSAKGAGESAEDHEDLWAEEAQNGTAASQATKQADDNASREDGEGEQKRKRRRRRRGARQSDDQAENQVAAAAGDEKIANAPGSETDANDEEDNGEASAARLEASEEPGSEEPRRKRRRRGKRGGRRNRSEEGEQSSEAQEVSVSSSGSAQEEAAAKSDLSETASNGKTPALSQATGEDARQPGTEISAGTADTSDADTSDADGTDLPEAETQPADKPRRRPRESRATSSRRTPDTSPDEAEAAAQSDRGEQTRTAGESAEETAENIAASSSVSGDDASRGAATADDHESVAASEGASDQPAAEPVVVSVTVTSPETESEEPKKPKRGGWWQRRGFI